VNKEREEQWMPIAGWEHVYEVSSLGRVKRISEGHCTRPGRVLRTCNNPDRDVYPMVTLCNKGVRHPAAVHGLVAAAFIGPRPDGAVVNHKDGNKKNNHVSNLEFVTPRENSIHAAKTGLLNPPRGSRSGWNTKRSAMLRSVRRRAKLDEDKVSDILESLQNGQSPKSLAEKYGVDRSTISYVKRGHTWQRN
jgi:hypothetical protein